MGFSGLRPGELCSLALSFFLLPGTMLPRCGYHTHPPLPFPHVVQFYFYLLLCISLHMAVIPFYIGIFDICILIAASFSSLSAEQISIHTPKRWTRPALTNTSWANSRELVAFLVQTTITPYLFLAGQHMVGPRLTTTQSCLDKVARKKGRCWRSWPVYARSPAPTNLGSVSTRRYWMYLLCMSS